MLSGSANSATVNYDSQGASGIVLNADLPISNFTSTMKVYIGSSSAASQFRITLKRISFSSKTLSYTLTEGGAWKTFPISTPFVEFRFNDYSSGQVSLTYSVASLAVYGSYQTIGYLASGVAVNVARTANNQTIYVSASTAYAGTYVECYSVDT